MFFIDSTTFAYVPHLRKVNYVILGGENAGEHLLM